MPNLHLRPLGTPEEIAHTAARELVGLLKRRGDRSIPFGLALSGGRIARTFYQAIRVLAKTDDFQNVHFFWADERCVPASDPENNYATARQYLFEPLRIPEETIHRIRGEVDPKYAVEEAEAELCRLMPLTDMGQPILDVVILGMGEDGHVASLFPEEPIEMVADPRVYRKVTATKPPPDRITLGYQPIVVTKEVWVLASGRGKTEALTRVRKGDRALPLARVVAERTGTMIFHEDVRGPDFNTTTR
jgi:6-phosphogluconolactonase